MRPNALAELCLFRIMCLHVLLMCYCFVKYFIENLDESTSYLHQKQKKVIFLLLYRRIVRRWPSVETLSSKRQKRVNLYNTRLIVLINSRSSLICLTKLVGRKSENFLCYQFEPKLWRHCLTVIYCSYRSFHEKSTWLTNFKMILYS